MEDRLNEKDKAILIESILDKVSKKTYNEALIYAKEFLRTQHLITEETILVIVASAHRKQYDIVKNDFNQI